MSNNDSGLSSKRTRLHQTVPEDTRILIVEDSDIQRKSVQTILKTLGFENIYECENGKEAERCIKENRIQCVICDWNMPEMNGLELLQLVRQNPFQNHLPFIFLTAHADKDRVVQALENGANDYIVKPASPMVIEQKLARVKIK